MGPMDGRLALVTGATGGLGKAVASGLECSGLLPADQSAAGRPRAHSTSTTSTRRRASTATFDPRRPQCLPASS